MNVTIRSLVALGTTVLLLGCGGVESASGTKQSESTTGAGGAPQVTVSANSAGGATGTTSLVLSPPSSSGAGGSNSSTAAVPPPPPAIPGGAAIGSGATTASTGTSAAAGTSGGAKLGAGGATGVSSTVAAGGTTTIVMNFDAGVMAARDAGAASDAVFAPSPDLGPPADAVVAPDAGDKFVPVGTNPFVMTAHDPFSTFAADVDTASYDIFRRDAKTATVTAASSVRLEEYVNYFSYDYPAPAEGSPYPFQISLAATNQIFDRPTALLRVGVQAMRQPAFVKKPTNLVFLLDVSGSMGDANKLPLVQKLILATLDNLAASDHVSLVTYSTTAQIVLGTTSMENKAAVANAVAALSAGGSTAGADGIGLAYTQASAGFIAGGINHIVMCTDGDFNVGPSSTSELLNLIRSERNTGVTLTVLGFGSGNLNDAMMESVADAGNGIYSVIIDEASARDYAANKILATFTHVAKDMKIQVEFNPDKVTAYRLLGYEDRGIADQNFRNDSTDAGEVGAGHRVTALYEMVLTGGSVPMTPGAPPAEDGPASTLPREVGPDDFVLVKVRYKTVDATDATPAIEIAGSLPSILLTENLAAADPDLQWAAAVAALAEILKQSPYADKAYLPTIQAIANAQAARDADHAEFATLVGNIIGKL